MNQILRIVVVDDEIVLLDRLQKALLAEGYEVATFSDPIAAMESIKADIPHIVITDVRMEGLDGIELLQRVKVVSEFSEVIVLTGYTSLDDAVNATKKGAFHYLAKPFTLKSIRKVVAQAAAKVRQSMKTIQIREKAHDQYRCREMIGESPAMLEIFKMISKVAKVDSSVIIYGESGTGKELIATALHQESHRAAGPFVSFNCASFTDELMANELFGHEKGAFTGATTIKPGLLETADKGTLFLDEVADMPISMQVKLLRVLQERSLLRVGGVAPVRIDVRVIAATNKDLKELVKSGQFRNDLFYRLNVVCLDVPPLRQRKEDIPLLVTHFIEKYNACFKKKVAQANSDFWRLLLAYSFPGNVRELENIIERAVVLGNGDKLTVKELPPDLNLLEITSLLASGIQSLENYENDYIRGIYNSTGHNQQRTAELLNISRTTLWRKLKEWGGAKNY